VRALRLGAVLASALLSSACLVVSLQPVYEPETIAFDPALLGTWASADEDVTLIFERGEWHSYHLTVARRDDKMRATARLTRIGGRLYLDVTPLDGLDLPPLALPVHACYQLELGERTLSLAELNYEWMETKARAGDTAVPMVIDARRNVVITATTADLRRWIAANAEAEGVFAAPTPFTRR
jgi:hypothetical protein